MAMIIFVNFFHVTLEHLIELTLNLNVFIEFILRAGAFRNGPCLDGKFYFSSALAMFTNMCGMSCNRRLICFDQ